MRQVEAFLDKVMAAARLAPGDARRVRGELKDHLLTLVEARVSEGLFKEEAWKMVRNEFGEPAALGAGIAEGRGRVRTWLKKKARRLAVSLVAGLFLMLTVRSFAVGVYKVPTSSVEPYAVKGSHVLVNRLISTCQAEDLVVFRYDGKTWIGVVKAVRGPDEYVIGKTNGRIMTVKREALVGRVFLQTR